MEAERPEFTIEEVDVEVVRPLRHKHLRPDQPADAVEYQSDACETCRNYAARDREGRIIGVGTLHMENRVAGLPPFGEPGMRLRGMAVEDGWRGKGVGAGIVARMLEYGRAHGVAEAWGNARTDNLGFYLKNGFKEVSSPFVIPTIGEHVVVALSLIEKGRKARKARKAREAADDPADSDAGPDAAAGDAQAPGADGPA